MEKKQISILGCGWLGLPLAKHFISKGYKVKGSTTTQEKEKVLLENNIIPYVFTLGEVENDNVYKDFLKNSDILIINFPPKRIPDIETIYKTQVMSILPFVNQHQKVLFVSSTSVYQNTNSVVFEDLSLVPEKSSGKAVLAAENLLSNRLGLNLTIVRFAGLIGPDRFPGRFLAGKKDVSNGKAPVNVIHQIDCIGLIFKIVSKQCWGEIFNGCGDNHPSRQEFYTKAAIKIGLEPPTFLTEDVNAYKIISNKKSKDLLGFNYNYPDPMALLNL